MIAYERKNKKAKKRFIFSLVVLGLLAAGILTYERLDPKDAVPVFQEFPVIKLPDTEKEVEQEAPKVILPYKQGKKTVDYFDGETGAIPSIIEFEGVFRPSQGVDISNNGESFDVFSAMDGVVLEVMSDPLLGNGIRIKSDNMVITYQSLDQISYKKDDTVKQGDKIGSASTNIYQADLKNHLHIVCETDDVRVDPNTIFKFE